VRSKLVAGPGGPPIVAQRFNAGLGEMKLFFDPRAPRGATETVAPRRLQTWLKAFCRPAGAFGVKSLPFPTPEGVGYCRTSLTGRDGTSRATLCARLSTASALPRRVDSSL
jgi:hypothetical protein